ncbi:MAG: hypothetical protein IPL79_18705 [Myxococcales bacterium]|nr:hypothetical protein [Myxococcales bacterium]
MIESIIELAGQFVVEELAAGRGAAQQRSRRMGRGCEVVRRRKAHRFG